MRRNPAIFFAVIAAFAAPVYVPCAAAGDAAASSMRVPGARELEGRLIAPCCWTQTLDIHDSPIAEELRGEVGKRLKAGEPAAQIEDDLAARYGERIRAVPRGEDPRVALPVIVGGSMALAVVWLAWIGLGWLKRNRSAAIAPATPSTRSESREAYDEQLDDELKHLSDVS